MGYSHVQVELTIILTEKLLKHKVIVHVKIADLRVINDITHWRVRLLLRGHSKFV